MGIQTVVNKTVFRAPVVSAQKSEGGTGYTIHSKKMILAQAEDIYMF